MDNQTEKSPGRKQYQKPAIIYVQEIEVLAVTCPSGYSGLGSCRTDGVCAVAWE